MKTRAPSSAWLRRGQGQAPGSSKSVHTRMLPGWPSPRRVHRSPSSPAGAIRLSAGANRGGRKHILIFHADKPVTAGHCMGAGPCGVRCPGKVGGGSALGYMAAAWNCQKVVGWRPGLQQQAAERAALAQAASPSVATVKQHQGQSQHTAVCCCESQGCSSWHRPGQACPAHRLGGPARPQGGVQPAPFQHRQGRRCPRITRVRPSPNMYTGLELTVACDPWRHCMHSIV